MTIKTEDIIKRGFIQEHEAEAIMKNDRLIKVNLQGRDTSTESIWV